MRSRRYRSIHCLFFLLPALFLAGCGPTPSLLPSLPPSTPPPPTSAPTVTPSAYTVLEVWHSWGASEEDLVRTLLADYQAQHPGVTVRLRFVPVGRIVGEYEESVQAGEGPDLLVGRSHWIGRLAGRQLIAPLDDLLASEDWSHLHPFVPTGVEVQGRRYAWPYAAETVALYYNRAFVSDPPTTTAQMLDLAAMWSAPEQAGLAWPLSFYNTVGYFYAWGGQLLDEEGRVALDSAETRAWLNWLLEVRQSPGVIATDSYGQADARFKAGAVAMIVNGSWALPDYLHSLGSERLGVVPLPQLEPTRAWPSPYVGYHVLMINPVRLTEHAQETLDLLRFLGGPVLQSSRAQQLQMVPTWNEIDLSQSPLLAGFVGQGRLGRPRPVGPPEERFWDPVEQLLYNVISRRVPLDLALQETQQQVERLLQEEKAASP